MSQEFGIVVRDKNIPVSYTMDYKAVFKNHASSFPIAEGTHTNRDTGTGANPHDGVVAGGQVVFDISFNETNMSRDEYYWVKYSMSNSDAVNTPTFMQDCLTHFDIIRFEFNDSKEKIEINGLNIISDIVSDELKEYGLTIDDFLTTFRAEGYGTYAGTAVANGTDVVFRYPLYLLLNWLKRQIPNYYLRKLKLTMRTTPAPTSAKDTCLICKSNTTSSAYTKTNITFNDINFIKFGVLLRDPSLMMKPNLTNAIIMIPDYIEKVVTQSWNVAGTDKYVINLKDLGQAGNIQKIGSFVRVNASAYNSASAQKRYSGHKYILQKARQLDGDKKEFDFTESVFTQKLYEIQGHTNRYSNQLPPAVWTDTTDLSRYYLNMSNLYFDFNKIEASHDEIVNTLDSTKENWELSWVCNSALGTDCDLVILMMSYKFYKWDGNGMLQLYNGPISGVLV